MPSEGCSSCHSKTKRLDSKRACLTCHPTSTRHLTTILGPKLRKTTDTVDGTKPKRRRYRGRSRKKIDF